MRSCPRAKKPCGTRLDRWLTRGGWASQRAVPQRLLQAGLRPEGEETGPAMKGLLR